MKSKEDVLNDVSYRLYNCSFMFAKDQRTSYEVLAIYDIAMEEYAQQFASQPPAQGYADSVEFEDYMGSERDNFVNEINNQKWDTKMRTAAESLLICFDQMANRLAGYSAHPPATAGMEEAVSSIAPTDLRIKEKAEEFLNEYASDFPPGNATCFAAGAKWMKDMLLTASTPPAKDNCEHNWVSSVAYKGARICSKCSLIK